MGIEQELREAYTEKIVRLLSTEENFGEKLTPHNISKSLNEENPEQKYYPQKVERNLSILNVTSKGIFGYEKMKKGFTFFWISSNRETFVKWFEEWFGKPFKE